MRVCIVGTCTFGNFGKRIFVPERERVRTQMKKVFPLLSLLESFFFLRDSKDFEFMKKLTKEDKLDLFLDSGAFSAYSKGVEIDIDEYAEFIRENQHILTAYANLDVIGDPVATWKNQRYLENLGLNPVPTFHYGENVKWLKKYIKRGYDHIALGGMVPIGTSALRKWLDKIWLKYLLDAKGNPTIKIHGFGMTVFSLMFRYPWYSIDSTTWVLQAAMGQLYIPMVRKGEFCYTVKPNSVIVSNRAKDDPNYIGNLSPIKKAATKQYIKQQGFTLGRSRFTEKEYKYQLKENEKWIKRGPVKGEKGMVETILIEGLTNSDIHRKLFNCMYFYDLQNHFPQWPWRVNRSKLRSHGMFDL